MKKTDEKTLSIWKDRLKRSYRSRQHLTEVWDRVRDFYKGNYFSALSEQDRVCVNWMLSTIRQMVSYLYFQNPTMYFKPMSWLAEYYGIAPIMEEVVKHERRVMDAETEERKALLSGLLYGTGILKHGYHAEFSIEDAFAATTSSKNEQGISLREDLDLAQGAMVEHNTKIRSGHPWVRSVLPQDFFVDPEANTPEEARWFAHRFRRPWIEVLRDSRYKKSAREQVTPEGRSPWYDEMENDTGHWAENDEAVDSSLVTLYEIYDKTTQSVMVITADCDEPLLEKPYPFFGSDGPYEFFQPFPVDNSFWGLSYADSFSSQIEVLNKMRTEMMDHLQRWGKTRGAALSQHVDEEDLKRFAKTKDGDILLVNGTEKVTDAISLFPYPEIAGDAWRLVDLFYRDMEEVSGISEMDRGTGKGVQTATEASYIQQQSGLRITDMRYCFERLLRRSTNKVVQILRQFWGPERIVRITGESGTSWQFVQVTGDMVDADFEVDIEPGSTEKVDKNIRVRQTIDAMAQLVPLVPLLQQQGYDLNLPELVRLYLKNTEITKTPEKILTRFQQPMMQDPMMGQQQGMIGMDTQAQQAMLPAPDSVNNMNMQPWQTGPAQTGRMYSEAAYAGGA